ncbi:hypothetical protein ACIQXI_15010 [Lysinibacillus sp. NPDC097195]|uniref:hypothetical protein n=1 Tax=Lysinibacillus sp. NPDC097195 TaxID=3364141 RepID=UPI0038168983
MMYMRVTAELQQQNNFIVEVSQHILEVERNKGNVSSIFIAKLESYKVPLLKIVALDNDFKYYALRTLNALNECIDYAKGDKSARKRMISEYKAGDRIVHRLRGVLE